VARAVLIAAAAGLLVVGATVAQGGSAAGPLPGLPSYTAGYKSWTKLNRRPLPRRAADPHDGTKNVYASKLPPRGSSRYPVGTVIVKEAFRSGQRAPYLIAVMRKVRGVRANNGWVMIEWTRRSAGSRFSEQARGQVCYGCHVGARRTDYVFTKRR
jgi:Cytochrome P460